MQGFNLGPSLGNNSGLGLASWVLYMRTWIHNAAIEYVNTLYAYLVCSVLAYLCISVSTKV